MSRFFVKYKLLKSKTFLLHLIFGGVMALCGPLVAFVETDVAEAALEAAPLDGAYAQTWLILAPLPADAFEQSQVSARIARLSSSPRAGDLVNMGNKEQPRWVEHIAHESIVNLSTVARHGSEAWALAYTAVRAPHDSEGWLHLGTANRCMVFINGALVHASKASKSFVPERNHVRVSLREGINHCYIAAARSRPYWGFLARFDGAHKTPPPPLLWHRLMNIDNVSLPTRKLAPLPWRYRIGDDPDWAAADFNDSDWEVLPHGGVIAADAAHSPATPLPSEGTVWFRRQMEVSPADIGVQKLLNLSKIMTCEVFLDGRRIFGFGDWSSWFQDLLRRPEIFLFRRADPVFAVRYRWSLAQDTETITLPPFEIIDYSHLIYKIGRKSLLREQRIGILAVLAVFAVFLLSRYLSYRKHVESLLLALTACSGIAAVLCLHISEGLNRGYASNFFTWANFAATMVTALCGLMVLTIGWRGARSNRSLTVFAVLGIVLFALAWIDNNKYITFIFLGLVAAEYVRVYLLHIRRKRQGARLIGVAIFCYVAGFLITAAQELHYFPHTPYNVYAGWYGFCLLLILLSVYFAMESARTAKNLESLRDSIQEAMEGEQRRIGQDIHDGLVQHLSGVYYMAQALQQQFAENALKNEAEQLGELARLIGESSTQARNLSHALCPVELETDGIVGGLHALAAFVARSTSVVCVFQGPADTEDYQHLPLNVAVHLYRIAQEAVNNALKHAAPSRITITLARNDARNVLTVTDNGTGLHSAPLPCESKLKGLGIRSMEYRAMAIGGLLAIEYRPSGGVCVSCDWPHIPI